MGYEIDYLNVGEGEKSGDAICFRYGNLFGRRDEQVVVTIDGGTLESGQNLVAFIKQRYGTDRVDVAILSHPDADHASGMRSILENLRVGQVLMHLPWDHSAAVKDLLNDSRVTTDSVREKTKKNLSIAKEIATLANDKGIPIVEPFAGSKGLGLTVLGPTQQYYEELLSSFKFMPGAEAQSSSRSFATILGAAREAIKKWIAESWFLESLNDPEADATSPENNSSVVLLVEVDGKKLLFSGDAGVPAMNAALDFASDNGSVVFPLTFFDVPHHGSRRNVGPSLLNRLFGGTRPQDSKEWTAFISAAKDGAPKHPNKKVVNALRRRGASVLVTAGFNICHFSQAPARLDYSPLESLPLYTQVEDDD